MLERKEKIAVLSFLLLFYVNTLRKYKSDSSTSLFQQVYLSVVWCHKPTSSDQKMFLTKFVTYVSVMKENTPVSSPR